MLKKRYSKRIVCFMLALFLVLPVNVHARDRIDLNRKGTVKLSYVCPDIEFDLYRVGAFNEEGFFTLTDSYSQYPLSLDEEEMSSWQELSETVAAYIERDGLPADASNITDTEGNVTFSDLPLGLYLVKWNRHVYDGKVYTPHPFFLSVPTVDEQDQWIYEITSELKYGVEEETKEPVERHVRKIWDDVQNQEKKRPEKITVELLRDGQVSDTVELNEENDWRYDWTQLDAESEWKVIEKEVPAGYTVKMNQEGTTILITNTLKPEKPEEPRLPHTGLLWWPVPLCALAGMTLFGIGWLMNQKKDQE